MSEANTALPWNCSGAMYGGLPITVVPCAAISSTRDVPKSATFTSPCSVTSTLPGRRSRWMTLFGARDRPRWRSGTVKSSARVSSSAPSRMMIVSSVSPAMYSITMKKTPSCFSAVRTVTMLG